MDKPCSKSPLPSVPASEDNGSITSTIRKQKELESSKLSDNNTKKAQAPLIDYSTSKPDVERIIEQFIEKNMKKISDKGKVDY